MHLTNEQTEYIVVYLHNKPEAYTIYLQHPEGQINTLCQPGETGIMRSEIQSDSWELTRDGIKIVNWKISMKSSIINKNALHV